MMLSQMTASPSSWKSSVKRTIIDAVGIQSVIKKKEQKENATANRKSQNYSTNVDKNLVDRNGKE